LNKQKCHAFSFYLFSYFFYKIGEQEGLQIGEQVLPRGTVGTTGRGEVAGKGGRRVNTVQKMCTDICKSKNDTC
jgi:hypothetical protein